MQPITDIKDKAIAILKSLETGNQEAIESYISPDKYIQHNPGFPDGRQVIVEDLDHLKQVGTKANIQRVLVDGDYVALHVDYIFFGPKVGFDIFRFEDGQIVEHWDNLQEKVDKNPSGHTMVDGATEIVDLEKTAENKAIVKDFIETILVGGHFDKLQSYFNGDHYIQHNPMVADGVSGLGKGIEEMAKQGLIMKYDKLHMIMGQGNFVLTVSEGNLGSQHTSFYDLFRLENGKIAEHWDVIEAIPAKEEWKNENGKF
jgi:predicted SnoaL-like aldol condensation-catalyzing enzyme